MEGFYLKGFNYERILFGKDSIWKGFNPKGIDLKGKVESESRLGIHFFRPFFFLSVWVSRTVVSNNYPLPPGIIIARGN